MSVAALRKKRRFYRPPQPLDANYGAALRIIRYVAGYAFEVPACEAAAAALLRHPHASDDQLMDFLRWFSGDENPMP